MILLSPENSLPRRAAIDDGETATRTGAVSYLLPPAERAVVEFVQAVLLRRKGRESRGRRPMTTRVVVRPALSAR